MSLGSGFPARVLINTPDMKFACSFAQRAGAIARRYFCAPDSVLWKADETPVTLGDREIDKAFITMLETTFPDDGWLSEESGKVDKKSRRLWVLDPIDGTGPYSLGVPLFVIALSLVVDGVPELGVLYDPMLERIFYAQKGHGAYLNDQAIRSLSVPNLQRRYIHIDSLKTGGRWLLPLRQYLLEAGCTPLALNATQYAAALVCSGRMAGAVYSAKFPWDGAAVYAISTEAGCVMTDLLGRLQRYDQDMDGFILGSNAATHSQLLELVAACRDRVKVK